MAESNTEEVSGLEDFEFDGTSLIRYRGNKPKVVIPDFVTSIIAANSVTGERCFENCDFVKSITLPKGLACLAPRDFDDCGNLEEIIVDGDNENYYSDGNCVIAKESKRLVVGCKTSVIPEEVASIGDYAFGRCSGLTKIRIPGGVKFIGAHAFEVCGNLQEVTLDEGIIRIGYHAFSGCRSLKSISIPNSVINICNCAFIDCTALQELTVGTTECIGNQAFGGCFNIKKITIDSGNHYYYSEGNCIIDKRNNTLLFGFCSSVIPDCVTCIGKEAFILCNMPSEPIIPQSVKSIEEFAFGLCAGIKSLKLPKSVESIARSAFDRCYDLEKISVESGNEYYYSEGNCLIEKESKTLILGCKTSVIPFGVECVGESAFEECRGLTEITLPQSVKSIAEAAFGWCVGLTRAVLQEGVTNIGKFAFFGCVKLTTISIPVSVTAIEERAFAMSGALKDIFYSGTLQQWQAIDKSEDWDCETTGCTVHCTDGSDIKVGAKA